MSLATVKPDESEGGVRDALVEGVADEDLVSFERSPIAILHLVASAVALALLAGFIELFPQAHLGFEADLDSLTGTWGPTVGALADAVAATAAILAIVGALVAARLAHVDRHIVTVVAAAGLAGASVAIVERIGGITPGSVVLEEWGLVVSVAGVAVVSASFSVLAVTVRRWAIATIVVGVLVGAIGADVSIGARLMALVAGVLVGSLVALVLGTPSRAISRIDLAEAMERSRLPIEAIEPHPGDARGSLPWTATLATGRRAFVKVEVRDHRTADILFRTWRWIRLKEVDDERPGTSMRRAVEHEAFVAVRASDVGVRTPTMLGVGALPDDRGAFAAFEAIEGETLADVGDDVAESTLRGAWSQVQAMHRAGIAHRDLRAANLLVDDNGDPWVIDFGFAELGASDRSLNGDVVELLASTAAVVGTERAVDASLAVLGPEELERALPWVQPLATSTATRSALGRKEFAELRHRLRERLGVSEPEEPQLARIRLGTVLTVVALGVGIYVLLPQVTKGVNWGIVADADPAWSAVAVLASFATYIGAAVSMRGSVAESLPPVRTFEAQLASSFTNRITPAKVGGMAVNVRFLVKQGIDNATAATGVAVSTMAGTVVHLVLTIVAVLWAGDVGGASLKMPSGRTLAVAGGVVAAVVAVTLLAPPTRGWLRREAMPSARRSWQSLVEVIRTPANVVQLAAGSVAVTIFNIVALIAALAAFGESPPVSTVAVVYLAGSALASAAPTPGGLGAAEAALVAGLTLTGTDEQVAVPAVLLFRLATFWLPVLPGWLTMVHLQHRGDL